MSRSASTPAPPPAELAARLRTAIARSARRLRQEGDSGLTPSQTAALITIAGAGSLTPSELADAERIKRPTATRVVTRLEQRGLLSRTADPEDRRSHRVALTAEGEALLEASRRRRTAFLTRALRRCTAQEREMLWHAAALLEAMLEEER